MRQYNTFYLLLVFCLFAISTSCSKYNARRITAFDHIDMLKENVLLVRLKSEDKKIAALEKANKKDRITKTNAQLLKQNTAVMNAFRGNFKFCKVYFFYAREAKLLRQKEYNKLTLYDIDHKPVTDNSFIENGYLIAAVDYIYEFEFIEETDTIRKAVSGTFGFPSLVVMDKDFIQLDKPFPRRVINRGDNYLDSEEVAMLDFRLFKYYKRLQKLKARNARIFRKK